LLRQKKLNWYIINQTLSHMTTDYTAVAYQIVSKPAFQKIARAVLFIGCYLLALDRAVAFFESL
jgi:hypothetical protein